MADITWIKLATNTYEDEKIRLIDAMPNPDTNHYLWLRLLIQAGKTNVNGYIYLTEKIPYTDEMLATLFNRPLETIKNALKVFSDFQMIEIDPNNIIRIVNWDKHQNIEGMERVRAQNRKRAENHREKKRQIEQKGKDNQENEKHEVCCERINAADCESLVSLNETTVNSNTNNKEVKYHLDTGECFIDNETLKEKLTKEEISLVDKDVSEINQKGSNYNEKKINSTDDDFCNVTKDSGNVTKNKSNVTVTEQNKKEIENKKKNKREIETDSNINSVVNNTSSIHEDEKVISLSLNEKNNSSNPPKDIEHEDINSKAMELMFYHQKITGIVSGLDYVALRKAIYMHGEKIVKMAVDSAFEQNRTEMQYINGILKNWRREGYPRDNMEVKKNGFRSTGKSTTADKNEFAGFKPKEPRRLTEAQRERAEANLI